MTVRPVIPTDAFLEAAVAPRLSGRAVLGAEGAFDPPDALIGWLDRLQHLDGVPFPYLVPRPELLPPESLRFFFVDPDWQDRVVDGALAAAAAGTDELDALFEKYRAAVRDELAKRAGGSDERVTGLLLRSVIVRYHPRLYVRAFADTGRTQQLTVVRHARLSSDVLIVMFAGVPARVELEEPSEGAWFGAEREGDGYATPGDASDTPKRTLSLRPSASELGVIDIRALRGLLGPADSPSQLAWNLQNLPYRQVFQNDADGGRLADRTVLDLEALAQRLTHLPR